MQRNPSSRQTHSAVRRVRLCRTAFILLASLLPGELRAQAPSDHGSPRAGSLAVQRRLTRADSGFDFYDLRVQASGDNAPALRQVRSGQEVRVGVYVRYWKPARTKRASPAARSRSGASHSGNPFAATRARYVCRYTLLYKGVELRHDTLPIDLSMAEGSAVTTFHAFSIALPEGVRENTYLVRAAVTMNGATQTRTTRFTVSR